MVSVLGAQWTEMESLSSVAHLVMQSLHMPRVAKVDATLRGALIRAVL